MDVVDPVRRQLIARLSHGPATVNDLAEPFPITLQAISRHVQVLEAGTSEMTTKVLAALPSWKFRPVLRSDQPVEVHAILGFNIDTR